MAGLLSMFKRGGPEPPRPAAPAAAPMNFEELIAGGGCTIPLTEERGITPRQLGSLLAFIKKHCRSQAWRDRKGNALEWDTANLYQIVEHVVKPATKQKHCSYVELVARSKQVPKWFVSHWWGQKVAEFVKCLFQHSGDRELGEDVTYWVCAYAAIQWAIDGAPDFVAPDWVNMYATNQWYDPASSPFQKAMRMAEGTVSVIDSDAEYFARVWCCYEIWSTLMLAAASNLHGDLPVDGQLDAYKYDIYTVNGDNAVGLTDGFAKVDTQRARHWWTTNKYHREKHFPADMARGALGLRLETAKASQEADRKHILNSIVGAANLDGPPPETHARYTQLNNTVRGRFAAAVWRKALESDFRMTEYGSALAASGLGKLALSFDSCQEFDDWAAQSLAEGLPPTIQELDLDCNGCGRLSDHGVEMIVTSLPSAMRHLKVDLSGVKGFTAQGMKAVTQKVRALALEDDQGSVVSSSEISFSLNYEASMLVPLLHGGSGPPTPATPTKLVLQDLSLEFASCSHLPEGCMIELVRVLPPKLRRLTVNFYGCVAVGDDFLKALASALPRTLLFLELRVARCPDISDAGVEALAKALPASLQHLSLDLRFDVKLTDSSAVAISEHLPPALVYLNIDFVSCSGTTSGAEAVLRAAVARRTLEFVFWGKDDFAVNM